MLYSLSKIPSDDLLQQCINIIMLQKNAELLLYQDAVYLAINKTKHGKQINELANTHKIFVLEDDHIARGLQNKLLNNIIIINYPQFVELTIQHNKIISW